MGKALTEFWKIHATAAQTGFQYSMRELNFCAARIMGQSYNPFNIIGSIARPFGIDESTPKCAPDDGRRAH